MRSLNLKLVLLYVASALLIVVSTVAYTEYMHSKQNNYTATMMMESGPAFIDGETPWDFESKVLQRGDDINQVLSVTGLTAFKVYSNYLNGLGNTEGDGSFLPIVNSYSIPGGVSFNTSIKGPIEQPSNLYYKTYSLEISNSQIGPILLADNFFPITISQYTNGQILRQLYYRHVTGYDGVIVLASLDVRLPIDRNWWRAASSDLLKIIPVLFIVSLMLGWVISRSTILPIKRITKTAEKMSGRNMHLRVEVRSKDEVGRLASSFNEMANRLENAFIMQKQFVSDAAHELRTPLASMKTSLSLVLSKPREKEEYQELLEKLSSRLETMEKLTDNLLEQARADENISESNEKLVDISSVLTEVAEGFEPLFQDKAIIFNLDTEEELFVKGETRSLVRLFSNLLDNAWKNTPSGGSVSILAYKTECKAIISVIDTGMGIAPEHLDKIFERFYKLSGDGFGLGLSICRSIALRHGGTINAESRLGEGSTFTVEFPLLSNRNRAPRISKDEK